MHNSGKLSIFVQCTLVKACDINAHINPITLFSVHVNTTFRFVHWNKFNPIETKNVHVNIANERGCSKMMKHSVSCSRVNETCSASVYYN